MKKINDFTNQYQLSKTLRFSLIPVGDTLMNFEKSNILAHDEKRAEDYQKLKKIIDRYHKAYIEKILVSSYIDVNNFANLYYKQNKTNEEKTEFEKIESDLRKSIVKSLTGNDVYKKLVKPGDTIKDLIPSFVTDKEESELVESFKTFSTYFTGFFENRKNMYSDEKKSTAISYRIVNQNLPKFLDNIKVFNIVEKNLSDDIKEELSNNFDGLFNYKDMFTVDYFSYVMPQSGIDKYNEFIGGYTLPNGEKIKGINEYINLYNQVAKKEDKLPKLKPLFKQILSDRESISFIPEKFEDDNEVLKSIYDFYSNDCEEHKNIKSVIKNTVSVFENLKNYNLEGIYIKNDKSINDLSQNVASYWGVVKDKWSEDYEQSIPCKNEKNREKYEETKRKAYNSIPSFSIATLQEYFDTDLCEYIINKVQELADTINLKYNDVKHLLVNDYNEDKRLCKNNEAIEKIKAFLDSIKEFELFVKSFVTNGKEEFKDEVFYGEFFALFESISKIDRLYDKVRNYVTQKPYSGNKIKLNFDNAQLLNGWDRNKERDYCSVLLRKDEMYYLAIMGKSNNKVFENAPIEEADNEYYSKMKYKLLPGPNKNLPRIFFATKNLDFYAPSKEILEIKQKESFKKGANFDLDDCHKLIDFFKDSINKTEDWAEFEFKFSPTESYTDISQFYREVQNQGYKLLFNNISASYVDTLVKEGKIYLFQIYNKDFSKHSKGMPNLHTLYFKMLFDEDNLNNVVYKLNGQAEIFYRKASIAENEKIVHWANKPIKNKNPHNEKTESIFPYELVKDKRFTKPQFLFHFPITINFQAAEARQFNDSVRYSLKNCDNNYVIGIDRGERNLIYVCVVDKNGKIVEQISLNEIVNEYNGKSHCIDYHKLLDEKEKERLIARQSWGTIENIKELKEGYISQVVHKICELVVKYDAIIAMEDLNSGFKNSRVKVEKQVYQKFEKMLIDKLNYLVDKQLAPSEMGGLLNAYQLTKRFESFSKIGRQNGFIFYVPAWLTSKIDPTTGFVNLFNTRYTSVKATQEFINRFDNIIYNSNEDLFEFDFDYSKFPKCSTDYKRRWTVCTNSTRIYTFRNKDKNNEFDNQEVVITAEFKKFFEKYSIDYNTANLKEELLNKTDANFYKTFMHLFKLTVQMRNSITGRTDVDYLISPVKNSTGKFYDSRNANDSLPKDADANGAYNIARKALWAIEQIKQTDDVSKAKLSIKNTEWLEFAQSE